MPFIYTLYICKKRQRKGKLKMAVAPTDSIDKKLAKLYAQKTTVNLDSKSTLSPEEFWNSMSIIAMNNKAVMNFRTR